MRPIERLIRERSERKSPTYLDVPILPRAESQRPARDPGSRQAAAVRRSPVPKELPAGSQKMVSLQDFRALRVPCAYRRPPNPVFQSPTLQRPCTTESSCPSPSGSFDPGPRLPNAVRPCGSGACHDVMLARDGTSCPCGPGICRQLGSDSRDGTATLDLCPPSFSRLCHSCDAAFLGPICCQWQYRLTCPS